MERDVLEILSDEAELTKQGYHHTVIFDYNGRRGWHKTIVTPELEANTEMRDKFIRECILGWVDSEQA
jgi:hypothetical protein